MVKSDTTPLAGFLHGCTQSTIGRNASGNGKLVPAEFIQRMHGMSHQSIYDRLLEMCIPISCIGVSFRKENAQEKLERLKALIG